MDLDYEDFDIVPEEKRPIYVDPDEAWENEDDE